MTLLLALSLTLGCKDGDTTTDTSPIDVDADGDGIPASEDCNDEDVSVFPGSAEVCDGIDNDCDGVIDNGVTTTFYADTDGDGFGDAGSTYEACEKPEGYVPNDQDCDDTNAEVLPGGLEYCDGIDNNCDGQIDEDSALDASAWYQDTDGDGYGTTDSLVESCYPGSGWVEYDGDCDDADTAYHPGAPEEDCTDPADYNCDGSVQYADEDGDGFPACTECDDHNAAVNPDATEMCDGIDNDCNGEIDEDAAADVKTWYADADSDSYGDVSVTDIDCNQPSGFVADSSDCDDTDGAEYPGADEYCDGDDDDCDGIIDEDDSVDVSTWYADTDSDSYGDPSVSDIDCYQPSGDVADNTDCDDTDGAEYPGATEYCDGDDDDCDGDIDEDDAADVSTWYADTDSDSYGDPAISDIDCYQPSGYVADNTDCDDSDSSAYPTNSEYCDGIDNDCNGVVDDEGAVVDGSYLYDDVDGDGFGDLSTYALQCDGVDNGYDCDDADSTEPLAVDATLGSSSGDGSLTSPYDTIQAGIDAALECVVVYQGTYTEAIDFSGKDLLVTGVEGADLTVIDATGLGTPAVTFENGETSAAELSGFTLTGGEGYYYSYTESRSCSSVTTCTDTYYTYWGGGIYVESSDPTLYELVITGNDLEDYDFVDGASTSSSGDTYTFSYGGGVAFIGSNSMVYDVEISANDATEGGAVYVDSSSIIDLSEAFVIDNTALDGGGYEVDGGTLTETNVVVADNTADEDGGGANVLSGTLNTENVSYADNAAATYGSGVFYAGTASGTMENTIVSGSSATNVVQGEATASFSGSYNNVYNSGSGSAYGGITDPTGTSGNLSSDPLFVDAASDDWTLDTGSSSIDAGTGTDADGSTADQGAFGGANSDWND
ncbi:MAG: putative metal-binding motif-containing protein [Myxococcota bacterium]|nr:putative metal-binding motif-containing protein [Myxococcota bacterium]